jgi:hypothetical protein
MRGLDSLPMAHGIPFPPSCVSGAFTGTAVAAKLRRHRLPADADADAAIYEAKRSGRNRYRDCFDGIGERAMSSRVQGQGPGRILEQDHLQPLFEAAAETGRGRVRSVTGLQHQRKRRSGDAGPDRPGFGPGSDGPECAGE